MKATLKSGNAISRKSWKNSKNFLPNGYKSDQPI
jgi:ribosomal protein L28